MGLWRAILEHRDAGIFRQIPLSTAGHLYTSPMPTGAYDPQNRLLKIYKQQKINHIFSLVTDRELKIKARRPIFREYEKLGINYSRYVIKDYQTPSPEILKKLVEEALLILNNKQNLLVHCHAGVGRTSLAVSCIVMAADGISARQAINHVKNNMMVNITAEQIRLIEDFEPVI